MKWIFKYMAPYRAAIALGMLIKLAATMAELLLPYILEHIIDVEVPTGQLGLIFLWGALMIGMAVAARQLNVSANCRAVENAHNVSYNMRQDLFVKTANLSGAQFDACGLPSLISRMTSDSYNVQSCVQSLQTICIRAPIMLVGGICITLTMDAVLAAILCAMLPILLAVVLGVSRYGIPLYNKVQEALDDVVRVMRENITGIRVVKALSKEDYLTLRLLCLLIEHIASPVKFLQQPLIADLPFPDPVSELLLRMPGNERKTCQDRERKYRNSKRCQPSSLSTVVFQFYIQFPTPPLNILVPSG